MSPRPGFTKRFKEPYNRAKGWRANAYFAPVSIDAPYTYLTDLLDADGENTWRTAAHATGKAASNLLNAANFTTLGLGQGSRDGHLRTYSVDDAINFLQSVANSMRQHEKSYIRKRINDLKEFPGTVSQNLIQQFEKMTDDDFDYTVFISLLNEVHGKIQIYKERLNAFKQEGHSRVLERNITSSLQTAISNYTNRRQRYENSQEGIINMLTMRFFSTGTGAELVQNWAAQGLQGAKNFTAATALIQRELAQFLTDNNYLIYEKVNMEDENFIKQVNQLTLKLDDFAQERNIFEALGQQKLLDDLINIYGITIEDKALRASYTEKAKNARKKLNKMMDNLEISTNIFGKNTNDTFKNYLKRVKVKSSSSSLYIQDELQSVIISSLNGHTHVGKVNMATDLLAFIANDSEEDNEVIRSMQKEMDSIIEELHDNNAEHDIEKIVKIYEEKLKKLDQLCEKLNGGFIFHETNKLYTSIEGGRGFQKYGNSIQAFSGREIALLNYVDSMANFGQELGIDTAWLRFAAYNLAGNALGNGLISTLEEVLAIAAGLIMFDDFAQIAKDASGELTFASAENIHLYKLNGFYVPGSYFVQATLNCLTQMEQLSTSDAFFTKITAPGSVDYNREHEPPNPNPSDWESVRSDAISGTKIKIYFGANFLNLISRLQS